MKIESKEFLMKHCNATLQEYELLKTKIMIQDIRNKRQKFGPITTEYINYLNKVVNAPDVSIVIKLI